MPSAPLDLREFEWKIVIRSLTMDDFDALIELQQLCFPGMATWGRDQIASQIKTFPDGQVRIKLQNQAAGSFFQQPDSGV